MKHVLSILSISLTLFSSCQPEINKEGQASTTKEKENSISKIPEDVYYNKVLGMLVGSAIGDAMG
ncbi:MAG: hypothetical protein JJE09_04455, partial [Bacteroidia bacterium]|nr:hypothetical protein [Bacteroidia bacterium]